MFLLLSEGPEASFYGIDVLRYWWYTVSSYMEAYSWQVRTAYGIILVCVITLIYMMFLFSLQIRKRNRYQRDYNHCSNTYADAFQEIMETKSPLEIQEILDICDTTEDEIQHFDGMIFAEVISHIRMTMHDKVFITNLQLLCEVTGARRSIETRLKNRREVQKALQIVCTLPLQINEGLLSVYTSSNSREIRQLARIAHLMISRTEPFEYLLRDMDNQTSPWYRITVHRIMGWRKAQDQPVPPLLMMAKSCKNTVMTSFFIDEVAYWGSNQDKEHIIDFLNDPRVECRVAAVNALARLKIPETEQKLYDIYESQPQVVRRAILRALMQFHSGRYTDFFAEVFLTAPSHASRLIALECLYEYEETSILKFEELYMGADDSEKILFDQVRTMYEIRVNKLRQLIAATIKPDLI